MIDAEYVVEERVENYSTETTSKDAEVLPEPEEPRDIGQNGFLGNVDNALEGIALTRGDEQDEEWEDVDT